MIGGVLKKIGRLGRSKGINSVGGVSLGFFLGVWSTTGPLLVEVLCIAVV